MRRARRLLFFILAHAILFAIFGFLLNLIPFLQRVEVKTWAAAREVLFSDAVGGALFGLVWFFLEPVLRVRKRSDDGEN